MSHFKNSMWMGDRVAATLENRISHTGFCLRKSSVLTYLFSHPFPCCFVDVLLYFLELTPYSVLDVRNIFSQSVIALIALL